MKKALLVGNSNFKDPQINALLAPRNDVEELKALLEDKNIGGFDSVVCKFDLDYSDFKLNVSRLFKDVGKDDLVVFYYAGHGIRDDDGKLYLASEKTRSNDIDATALEAQYVLNKLRKSRSQKKVVILDCCHAGAVVNDGDFYLSRDVVDNAMLKDNFVPKGEGTYVLAACKAGANAFESKIKKSSVYTSKLIEAIKTGNAAPEKETLTILDIHEYIRKERLHDKDLDSSNPHTEPMMIGSHTDVLELCKNPKVRKPINPKLINALSDDDLYRRSGAVTELGRIVNGEDIVLAKTAKGILAKQLKKEKHLDVHYAIKDILDAYKKTSSKTSKSVKPAVPKMKPTITPKPVVPEPAALVSETQSLPNTSLGNTQSKSTVNPVKALSRGFKKAFDFKGRATRPEFWWFWLACYIGSFLISSLFAGAMGDAALPFVGVLSLALAVPIMAAMARRLHDSGRSSKKYLIGLVACSVILYSLAFAMYENPVMEESLIGIAGVVLLLNIVISILLIIACCRPSDPGPNKYGNPSQF